MCWLNSFEFCILTFSISVYIIQNYISSPPRIIFSTGVLPQCIAICDGIWIFLHNCFKTPLCQFSWLFCTTAENVSFWIFLFEKNWLLYVAFCFLPFKAVSISEEYFDPFIVVPLCYWDKFQCNYCYQHQQKAGWHNWQLVLTSRFDPKNPQKCIWYIRFVEIFATFVTKRTISAFMQQRCNVFRFLCTTLHWGMRTEDIFHFPHFPRTIYCCEFHSVKVCPYECVKVKKCNLFTETCDPPNPLKLTVSLKKRYFLDFILVSVPDVGFYFSHVCSNNKF